MDQPMVIAKLAAELGLWCTTGLLSLLAANTESAVAPTAIVAFIGFTGLLVRQVVSNQKMYVGIVADKDHELAEAHEMIHYLRWEAEKLRFTYGERSIDPGPYVPRRTRHSQQGADA